MGERGEAIVLIGFMGTGKSSAGRLLAERLALPRYETDEMVTSRFAMSIADIFRHHGEPAFRDAEAEALREIPIAPSVVVTGGGIVLRPENVARMRRLGLVIALSAAIDILVERLCGSHDRPLLAGANRRGQIAKLLQSRSRLYDAAADLAVDTSDLTPHQVAAAIIHQLSNVRQRAG